MIPAAREMLAAPEDLAHMQSEAEHFVTEMHDNRRETAAYLAGLTTLASTRQGIGG
jgi:hypothetical protein